MRRKVTDAEAELRRPTSEAELRELLRQGRGFVASADVGWSDGFSLDDEEMHELASRWLQRVDAVLTQGVEAVTSGDVPQASEE